MVQVTLDKFCSSEEALDLEKVTLKDVIQMLRDGSFDKYFSRGKIIEYLQRIAQNFKEYYGREFCPRCGSTKLITLTSYCGVKPYFQCKECGKRFTHKTVVETHFEDWVISATVRGVFAGKAVSQIHVDILNQRKDMDKTNFEGLKGKRKIPYEKTLYDIINKLDAKLLDFSDFEVLLLGGLICSRLMCDDAFARKWRRKKGAKQTVINGNLAYIRVKRHKRSYYYAIIVFDPDGRFIVAHYGSDKRDKEAFEVAFRLAIEKLKSFPKSVKGDKLRAMVQAAERCFPKSQVMHEFEKLKPFEKKELCKIERCIRRLRKTVGKRRRYGSLKVLRNYLTIAVIGTNYLTPMKVLEGKTPAQNVGIPYPFYEKEDWNTFLEWVRIIDMLLPQILKAGLKRIPGTLLRPIISTH
jgi:transcription elongation factor Elf1/transposase-like protein